MIILTNSHYLTYTFLFKRLGESTFLNLGVKMFLKNLRDDLQPRGAGFPAKTGLTSLYASSRKAGIIVSQLDSKQVQSDLMLAHFIHFEKFRRKQDIEASIVSPLNVTALFSDASRRGNIIAQWSVKPKASSRIQNTMTPQIRPHTTCMFVLCNFHLRQKQ